MNLPTITLDALEVEASQIDAFLLKNEGEEINVCAARGNDLAMYMARTGKMLADAKYF